MPPRLASRRSVLFGLLACLWCTLATVAVVHANVREYEVKAAYLFNFANFATWPAASFDGPAAPFRFCMVGRDPFGAALSDTLRGEKVGGHPLTLVHGPDRDELHRCHILFVPANTPEMESVLRAAASGPVLTVGEDDAFVRAGGVLRFAMDEGRVRFDVNTRPADKAGLSLSSRLLQVARRVQR